MQLVHLHSGDKDNQILDQMRCLQVALFAPAPEPTPAPPDPLGQLALAIQSLMTQASSTTSVQPMPYAPDFRKELNMTMWPSYSGDFRTFRTYKKDVIFTLGMLPQ